MSLSSLLNDQILFGIDPQYKDWVEVGVAKNKGTLTSGKSFNQLTEEEKTQYFQDPNLAEKIAPYFWSMGELPLAEKQQVAQNQINEWKASLPMTYTPTYNPVYNMTDPQTNEDPQTYDLNRYALDKNKMIPINSTGGPMPLQNYNVFAKLSPTEQKDVLINNPNIITPEGGQYYDPTTNTFRLFESDFTRGQRLDQERLAMELSRGLSGNLPSTDNEAVRNTTFELGKRQLDPEFKSQREALATQLANQGIPINSEAYNSAMNRLERSQGEQLNTLSLQSQLQGIQTAEAQRQARFNEISSLLGRSQVGTGASFGQMQSNYQGLDLMGAEQANLNRLSQEAIARRQANAMTTAARWQSIGSAIGGIAGGLGGFFSDITLKTNIKFENKFKNNLPIYTFEYINKKHGNGRYEGVMAQDVEKIYPEAVSISPEGYKMVHYSKINVDFRRIQ